MKKVFLLFLLLVMIPVGASALTIELESAATWTYGGHTYTLYVYDGISWSDAVALLSDGEYLATITSEGEQAALSSALTDAIEEDADLDGEYWLGGYRVEQEQLPESTQSSSDWAWVTGEAWDFTSWRDGEPNDTNGNEDYLAVWKEGWNWNDEGNLNNITGFIVESEPVPEPATMMLLGTGLLGIVGASRRKKK